MEARQADTDMRVLWLTYYTLPDLARALGQMPAIRGGWVSSLAEALVKRGQLELAIATNIKHGTRYEETINGIRYYAVPSRRGRPSGRFLSASLIREYQRIEQEFRPDLVHVHGTEYCHGLLTGRGYLKTPAVISIQGIMDMCARYYWSDIPCFDLLVSRTCRDWIRRDGLLEQKLRWHRRAKAEREIFQTNSAFIGRTLWDRAHLRRLNPVAQYYHVDRILRPVFYRRQWRAEDVRPFTILAPSAAYPIKGFHVLVKAVALLRRECPGIQVRVPLAYFATPPGIRGLYARARRTGYADYLHRLITACHLTGHIKPLGVLGPEEMADEYARAHVFVMPSLVENSPNALAEAMMIGTPSVAAAVGGVPSMVTDGVEALTFPRGDEAVLAEQIRRLLLDGSLGSELSRRARATARHRHAPQRVVRDIMNVYSCLVSGSQREDLISPVLGKPAHSGAMPEVTSERT